MFWHQRWMAVWFHCWWQGGNTCMDLIAHMYSQPGLTPRVLNTSVLLQPLYKVPFSIYMRRSRLSTNYNVNPSAPMFNAQSRWHNRPQKSTSTCPEFVLTGSVCNFQKILVISDTGGCYVNCSQYPLACTHISKQTFASVTHCWCCRGAEERQGTQEGFSPPEK